MAPQIKTSHWSLLSCEWIKTKKNVDLPECRAYAWPLKSFHKTLCYDNKRTERARATEVGGWDENLWKGASVWIKTVGVRGGWGGPVTPDLLPPGPFRAAQWLTPVSFQSWHYYYLHQSVGETQKDRKRPEVLWSGVHQPHANNTPFSPSLAKTGAFPSPCLSLSANLSLFNYFR